MAKVGDKFKPGEQVPTSGEYECDGTDGHRQVWSTDVRGKVFPPFPHNCRGRNWVLKRPTP